MELEKINFKQKRTLKILTIVTYIISILLYEIGICNGQLLNEETVWEARRAVGMVFQNPDNQFVGATVEDDIAFGLENRCIPQNEMQSIIEEYAPLYGCPLRYSLSLR